MQLLIHGNMKTSVEKGKCYEIGDWLVQIDRIDERFIWGFGADSDRVIGFLAFPIDSQVTREVPINDYINYIDVARQNIAYEYKQRLSQYEE